MMNMGAQNAAMDGSGRDRMNAYTPATDTASARLSNAHGCFGQMDLLQRRSVELAARVQRLVDRLVGPTPEKEGSSLVDAPINSMLDAIQISCLEPNRQMARALDALDRLENALPQ